MLVSSEVKELFKNQDINALEYEIRIKKNSTIEVISNEFVESPITEDIGTITNPIGQFPIGSLTIKIRGQLAEEYYVNYDYEIEYDSIINYVDSDENPNSETVTSRTYTVQTATYDKGSNKTTFSCLDYGNKLVQPYKQPTSVTYPISFKNWVLAYFNDLGFSVNTEELFNADYMLLQEPNIDEYYSNLDIAKRIALFGLCIGYFDNNNVIRYKRVTPTNQSNLFPPESSTFTENWHATEETIETGLAPRSALTLGRNYILTSNNPVNKFPVYGGTTIQTEQVNMTDEWGIPEAHKITTTGGTSNSKIIFRSNNVNVLPLNLKIGDILTFSIWVKNVGENNIQFHSQNLPPIGGGNATRQFILEPGYSGKFVIGGQIVTEGNQVELLVRALDINHSLSMVLANMKLEKSENVSDWSPAWEEIPNEDKPLTYKLGSNGGYVFTENITLENGQPATEIHTRGGSTLSKYLFNQSAEPLQRTTRVNVNNIGSTPLVVSNADGAVFDTVNSGDNKVAQFTTSDSSISLGFGVEDVAHDLDFVAYEPFVFEDDKVDTISSGVKSYKTDTDMFKTLGVNTLVLGLNSSVQDENISRTDTSMIEVDGTVEIRLDDIPFVPTMSEKAEVIDSMFNEIKGFKYRSYELESRNWFYEIGDVVEQTVDTETYRVPIFRIENTHQGSVMSTISATSESSQETLNKWSEFNPRRRAEIEIDKVNRRITLLAESTQSVNIIRNPVGMDGTDKWSFISEPVKSNNTTPAKSGSARNDKPFRSINSNDSIVQIVATDTLAQLGFEFWKDGKMISDLASCTPGELYYLRLRTKGKGGLKFAIREYNQNETLLLETQLINALPTTAWQTYEGNMNLLEDTTHVRLVVTSTVNVYANNEWMTFSDLMFTRGMAKNYEFTGRDVFEYSRAQFTLLSNEMELMVKAGDIINSINLSSEGIKILATLLDINGVISANGNFKVNLDGTIEAVNGKFSGTVHATEGSFSGSLYTRDGVIGDFNINTDGLKTSYYSNAMGGTYVFGLNTDKDSTGDFKELKAFDITLEDTHGWLGGDQTLFYVNWDGRLSASQIWVGSRGIRPSSNNTPDLGDSSFRFRYIYLVNSPNVSSDARYKYDIEDVDPLFFEYIKDLKPKMYHSVYDDNWHFGYIAQDVERVLYKYCYKRYGRELAKEMLGQFAVLSKDESYMSLIYGELAVLIDAYTRNELNKLEDRVNKLEGNVT